MKLHLGIDIGSTTAKAVATQGGKIVYSSYQRHNTRIKESILQILDQIKEKFGQEKSVKICLTGSAAMGIAEQQNLPFVQEVIAASEAIQKKYTNVHTLVDIGGEDAKIIFFEEGKSPDIRMNGSCAGGTGAFIDQIATLLNVETQELNKLAEQSTQTYTIASRCGVFAKTDVQNLISRKVPITDIAASAFHAVALQVINALSRGIDIKPNVLFVGGPLTYIPALQKIMRKFINCTEEQAYCPENSELFPAIGSALVAGASEEEFNIDEIYQKIERSNNIVTKNRLEPLFKDENDFETWKQNRKIVTIPETQEAPNQDEIEVFLGIDSGSTTTKVVLLNAEGKLIASHYDTNKGNPILAVTDGLEACCNKLQCKTIKVLRSAVTGYGEDLIRAAFNIDEGIVETIAHTTAAKKIEPEVSFILDIGGQDMKAIFLKNGKIQNVEINEACSSGCGSFVQNFAQTLNHTAESFGVLACYAPNPCDLGSRCTVFMNSQVKQSLREGAAMSEIAAGLAYSVIKNALFKVLQIKNMNVLGEKILVQGGTFKNPSIFRAMETLTGKAIYSSNKPELMGALGAAYYAQTQFNLKAATPSLFIGYENRKEALAYTTRQINCRGCSNSCIVTKFTFTNGTIHYSGNKCEKIFTSKGNTKERGENLYEFKYDLLFNRDMDALNEPRNIKIGIPRILGMYANFPFWNTLFTHSGIDVVLSDESTTKIFEMGQGTIMADNICFPAKLAHGHIFNLVEKNVDRIFYPLAIYEENEYKESKNSYNCPIVSSYGEVLDSAIPAEKRNNIPLDKPIISFRDDKLLRKNCWSYLKQFGVKARTFENAFDEALREQKRFREQYKKKGFRILERAKQEGRPIVMLAGRPYHTDHLVHQKTSQILSELGASVITEEVVENIKGVSLTDYLHVAQWNYPNRILRAAQWVINNKEYDVHFVQMNSFGCGPDSFLSDEIKEYFEQAKKSYTFIRVDEINSTGSMRLRLRSLIETILLGEKQSASGDNVIKKTPSFTHADKKRTIIAPFFTKFHSPLIPAIFECLGYHVVTLPVSNKESVNMGLAYTNNEICFPATLVIGDILKALKSGEYDLNNTAVIMTQTGGQCRASNYLALIRKAILNCGITNVPVVSFATGGSQTNEQPGFELEWQKVVKLVLACALFGDILSRMHYATIVREKEAGGTEKLTESYLDTAAELARHNDHLGILKLLKRAVQSYNEMALDNCPRPEVGIVGEIYLKYNPYANMHVADWLISQGIEPRFPDLMDFFTQEFINLKVNTKHNLRTTSLGTKIFADYLHLRYNRFSEKVEKIASKFKYYRPKHTIEQEAENAKDILSLVNQFGEGWLIPAEIVSFSQEGVNNVVSLQPFGCIANHIISKGIEKRIKTLYPKTSLLFLDFDGNTSEVNVFNRLHFLAQNAKTEFEASL